MQGHRLLRMLRHGWIDDATVGRTLPPSELEALRERIEASERLHSGEICIHVEPALPWSCLWRGDTARERALALFGMLRVWDTERNNGVLIYLLLADRAVEVVADRGLRDAVPEPTWQTLATRMGMAFSDGRFGPGLARAVDEVSALLVQHFPLAPGQVPRNELPDTPTGMVRSGGAPATE